MPIYPIAQTLLNSMASLLPLAQCSVVLPSQHRQGHVPGHADLCIDMTPIMDLDTTSPPPNAQRDGNGVRQVEEWSLKVQKLANVHSATLYFVSRACVPPRFVLPASFLSF